MNFKMVIKAPLFSKDPVTEQNDMCILDSRRMNIYIKVILTKVTIYHITGWPILGIRTNILII